MSNAERQAAWRARQKELGVSGRGFSIRGLTLDERNYLVDLLGKYRRGITSVTEQPSSQKSVTSVTTYQAWLCQGDVVTECQVTAKRNRFYVCIDGKDRLMKQDVTDCYAVTGVRGVWVCTTRDAADRQAEVFKTMVDVLEKINVQRKAEQVAKQQTVENWRRIRKENHPDFNPNADTALYQQAVEALDHFRIAERQRSHP